MKNVLIILLITSSMCYAQAPEKKTTSIVEVVKPTTNVVMNNGLLFVVEYDPVIGPYIVVKADTAVCKIKPSAGNSTMTPKNDASYK